MVANSAEDYASFVRREMPTLVRRELEVLFDQDFHDIQENIRPRVAEIVMAMQSRLLIAYKQTTTSLCENPNRQTVTLDDCCSERLRTNHRGVPSSASVLFQSGQEQLVPEKLPFSEGELPFDLQTLLQMDIGGGFDKDGNWQPCSISATSGFVPFEGWLPG